MTGSSGVKARGFALIRQQGVVSDRQFLRSMIRPDAGAILMCEQAPISDIEVHALCREIAASQRREVDSDEGRAGASERVGA